MQSTNREISGETSPKPVNTMLIALGANLTSTVGAPAETLFASINSLKNCGAVIRHVSSFYSTPAYPAGNGPDYVNAAVQISAPWDAATALAHLHSIEAEFGRHRSQRWGQRTLDLDLIAMDDLVLPDPQTHQQWRNLPQKAQARQQPDQLILPHPRLQDRAFVLVPLADVAPDWHHPLLGLSVRQMLAALPEAAKKGIKPLQ